MVYPKSCPANGLILTRNPVGHTELSDESCRSDNLKYGPGALHLTKHSQSQQQLERPVVGCI